MTACLNHNPMSPFLPSPGRPGRILP